MPWQTQQHRHTPASTCTAAPGATRVPLPGATLSPCGRSVAVPRAGRLQESPARAAAGQPRVGDAMGLTSGAPGTQCCIPSPRPGVRAGLWDGMAEHSSRGCAASAERGQVAPGSVTRLQHHCTSGMPCMGWRPQPQTPRCTSPALHPRASVSPSRQCRAMGSTQWHWALHCSAPHSRTAGAQCQHRAYTMPNGDHGCMGCDECHGLSPRDGCRPPGLWVPPSPGLSPARAGTPGAILSSTGRELGTGLGTLLNRGE